MLPRYVMVSGDVLNRTMLVKLLGKNCDVLSDMLCQVFCGVLCCVKYFVVWSVVWSILWCDLLLTCHVVIYAATFYCTVWVWLCFIGILHCIIVKYVDAVSRIILGHVSRNKKFLLGAPFWKKCCKLTVNSEIGVRVHVEWWMLNDDGVQEKKFKLCNKLVDIINYLLGWFTSIILTCVN